MTFSAETAVALWQAKRGTNLVRLARLLGEETQIPDLVRDIALDLVQQSYRPLLSRLATYIMEASDSLDDKLTWENIRNDSLRAWLEKNDDVAETLVPFIKGISDLAEVIEKDANSLQGRDEEEVAADVALDLLGAGSGKAFRFFRRERGRLRDRPLVEPPNGGENLPRLITEREQADEEALALIETLRSELQHLTQELQAEKLLRQEAEALLEAIEQAEVEGVSLEPDSDPLAPVDDEEEEEEAVAAPEPVAEPEPAAEAMSVGERAKRLSSIDYPGSATAKRRSRRQRKRR